MGQTKYEKEYRIQNIELIEFENDWIRIVGWKGSIISTSVDLCLSLRLLTIASVIEKENREKNNVNLAFYLHLFLIGNSNF